MRRWIALLALCLGVWPFWPVAAAGAADAMLAQAGAALASGQYAAATTLATGGLAQSDLGDQVRCRLLVIRGLSAQALGRADEALVDFTRALQGGDLQGEERARALFARGLSLDGAGRLKEAIGDYSAALTFAPGATYALNNRGNVFRRQGQFAEAKRDYAAALGANTTKPQYPYFGLGQIAEAEGDMQAARNFYRRAVAADPAFQLALERLQAMGPPVEGSLAADTGVIVLRPPPPRERTDPVILPPPRREEAAVRPSAPLRSPVVAVSSLPALSSPPPGRGAPLRPAIVEGRASGGSLAQLGAWRSEAEARKGWYVVQSLAGDLLENLTPVIIRTELPGRGVYYRLRVAAGEPVSQFCATVMAKGLACIPARE